MSPLPDASRSAGRTQSAVLPILTVNFVGALGFSIVLPFLVFLVTRWGGNALIYGVVGATYSAFQLVGAPLLGRWSDRYGRRRILLLSQLGTLFSWCIFVVAFALPVETLLSVDSGLLGSFVLTGPLLLVFVARALDGLTGGNISVANAYLADVTPEENRSANYGRMAVAANLGFVLGPAIAGGLGGTPWGELLPILAAVTVSIVASLLIIFRLPESNPCVLARDPARASVHDVLGQDHKPCYEIQGTGTLSTRGILRLPGVAPLLLINFLVMLGFNFFYVAFPMFAVEGLAWSVRETGVFFSVLSVMMAVVQGPILARASRRWREGTLAAAGSLILAASFPLIGSLDVVSVYAGAALLALGNGLMWPSITAAMSKAAGDRYQGAVQGLAGSLGAAAGICGLVAGGVLFGLLDERVFWIPAAVVLLVFAMTLTLSRNGSRADREA